MKRAFWIALDSLGHAIPALRFGRVRYAICIRMLEQVFPEEEWR